MTRTRRTALAIFVSAFIVYLAPAVFDLAYKPFFGYVAGQDIVSTTVLPVRLLSHGDFYLSEYMDFFQANWRSPYFVAEVNGQVVSRYPVGTAILALPLYGLPLGLGWIDNPPVGWLFFPWSTFFVAKLAAALMTALTVVMFFFCARELTDLRTSAITTVVFAFGTSVWSSASQGLWQQTPSILLQCIGIWFLLRGRRMGPRSVIPGAIFFSGATVVRANVGFTALLSTAYVLVVYRSAIVQWMLLAIPPALLTAWYNIAYNGSPWVFGYQDGFARGVGFNRPGALLGLFVSPSRGLFVYSPILLFAPLGFWYLSNKQVRLFHIFSAGSFAVGALILGVFPGWDGGWGYGTRMLTDVLPYISLLLVPVIAQLRGAGLIAFGVAATWSAVAQMMGLWDYGTRWYWHFPNWRADVWSIADSEPLFYVRQFAAMAQRLLSNLVPQR